MSVQLQERPRVETRRYVQHIAPRTVTTPAITVRTRYIERPSRKVSVVPGLVAKMALFSVVTLFSFSASSLAGQVMVEKARKDVVEARVRTQEAKKAEASLRDRVDLLTRVDKIEEWAVAQGMVAADSLGVTADVTPHGAIH